MYVLCHGVTSHCGTSVHPYIRQWSRCVRCIEQSGDCREKKDEEERDGWREGKAREKRAVSPSMLLLKDKAEDADVCTRVNGYTEGPFAISFRNSDLA